MERNLSDSTNLLAEDWRPRVEAAWDCPLSAAQVSSLEVFCSLTVMHLRVDADTRADAFLGVLSPRVIADGREAAQKDGPACTGSPGNGVCRFIWRAQGLQTEL